MRLYPDPPLVEPKKAFADTFSAESVVTEMFFSCVHCASGNKPIKLKRQYIHHDRATGRNIVCMEATLKSNGD